MCDIVFEKTKDQSGTANMAYQESGTQDPKLGPGMQDPHVGRYGGTLRWDPSVKRKTSHSQFFFKIGVLKHFAIFTEKNLCWNLLLMNETPTQVFSCE